MSKPGMSGQGNGTVRAQDRARRRAGHVLVTAAACSAASFALAQNTPQPEPTKSGVTATKGEVQGLNINAQQPVEPVHDGAVYVVSRFILEYARANATSDLPDLHDAKFENLRVTLGKSAEGYVSPRAGVERVTIRLSDFTEGSGGKFYQSAIEEICRAVVEEFNRRGIVSLFVAPNPEDIEEREPFKDKREGRAALRLSVYTGVVKEVRTVASGDRDLSGEKINNPAHRRVLERSPLKPGDLLRKDKLDNYLYRLNRHLGRRVDASIAAASAEEPGAVELDYHIIENKPWTAYFQLSNTGTENTDVWRERFGFVHNQLTNHDDTLRLEYSTAGFDASNAFIPSYEFPIFTDVVRGRVFGSIAQFTASDVGQNNENFSGNSWSAGGELIGNVFQSGPFFIDVVGGVRVEHYRVVSSLSGADEVGKENFLLPSLALRAERYTDASSTFGEIGVDFTATDADLAEVQKLGRGQLVDENWVLLKWNAEEAFYLEPILNGARGTPDGSGMTLAHELSFAFRGQYAFGNRLIPNQQAVAGGLYTVRGYPESAVAGDNLYLANFEYRFHFPNSMGSRDPGKFFGRDFRWAPQGPYGRADWDLIFKGFVDAARVTVSDIQPFESDVTLVGAGVGAELQLSRYLNMRLDWGFPLKSIHTQDRDVTAGKSQVHFVATLSF